VGAVCIKQMAGKGRDKQPTQVLIARSGSQWRGQSGTRAILPEGWHAVSTTDCMGDIITLKLEEQEDVRFVRKSANLSFAEQQRIEQLTQSYKRMTEVVPETRSSGRERVYHASIRMLETALTNSALNVLYAQSCFYSSRCLGFYRIYLLRAPLLPNPASHPK